MFFKKIAKYCKRWKKEMFLFWRYAPGAKIHFKYKSKKIIMLRLDLIGDCTMFTGAAKAIREYYKDCEMTMVCLSISKPIFERLGIFDRIITVDFKPHDIDYAKLKNLIRLLREATYNILLQPQASKLPVADIIAASIRCNKRIAIETKPGNSRPEWVKMVNFLYDEFIPYPRGNKSEFDYYGAFVRGLCDPNYKTVCPSLPYEDQHFIEGDYFVLYPGGSLRQKFWPADRFAQLANYIYRKTGLLCVILGVSDEHWVVENICASLDPQTAMSVIDLTGRTSIFDVIDIIGNSKIVVTNDTSGVHIACATKTPSVVDVGGWHYDRFLPYHIEHVEVDDKLPLVANTYMPCYFCDWNWDIIAGRNEECLNLLKEGGLSPCIEAISFEQMRELVDQIIEEEDLCCND